MIKVNLLAQSPGAAAPREWFPREQRAALSGLGMLVVTAVAVAGWWFYLHGATTTLDTRVAKAESDIIRLKEAAKLVDQATARRAELAERLALIGRLRASKRAPVSLLETVSRSMPDGLWLTEMKQTGGSVQIDGRAMSLTAITDFAERMQNSGAFQRPVEILTTTNETLEDTNIVRFSVKAEAVEQSAQPASAAQGGKNPSVAQGVVTPGASAADAAPIRPLKAGA